MILIIFSQSCSLLTLKTTEPVQAFTTSTGIGCRCHSYYQRRNYCIHFVTITAIVRQRLLRIGVHLLPVAITGRPWDVTAVIDGAFAASTTVGFNLILPGCCCYSVQRYC